MCPLPIYLMLIGISLFNLRNVEQMLARTRKMFACPNVQNKGHCQPLVCTCMVCKNQLIHVNAAQTYGHAGTWASMFDLGDRRPI